MNKKNGKIELLRFIFCIIVACYHLIIPLGLEKFRFMGMSFFAFGRVGVEFFFLLSGFFLANSVRKMQGKPGSVSKKTVEFTAKKWYSVMPIYVPIFIVVFIVDQLIFSFTDAPLFDKIIGAFPNLFLFYYSNGIWHPYLISVVWYISKMLLAGAILFPLLYKNGKTFARVICPIIAVFCYEYMLLKTGCLGGDQEHLFGLFSKWFLRALGGMSLGIFMYELVGYLKKLDFKKGARIFFTCFEVALYIFAIVLTATTDIKFEGHFIPVIFTALTITLSDIGFGGKCFNNKFVYFLGKLSLPFFLCHKPIIWTMTQIKVFKDMRAAILIPIIFAVCIVLSLAFYFIGNKFKKITDKVFYKFFPRES